MEYYSQNGQDRYLNYVFFKTKRDGTFVELGADNGVDKSNTLFFEEKGWTGLCIEPSPLRFKDLRKNRKCHCHNGAIGMNQRKSKFLDIIGYGKGLSGLVEEYHEKHKERINSEIKNQDTKSVSEIEVEVDTMKNVLEQYKLNVIDYFSLDVEGSEYSVLKSMDLQASRVNVFTVEQNYKDSDVTNLLLENNYMLFGRIGSDLIFVNNDFIKPAHYVRRFVHKVKKRIFS